MRYQKSGLIAFLAGVLLLPAGAFAARECIHEPTTIGKQVLYPLCHCTTYDYAALAEKLNAEGVRIARKQAIWKNAQGLAKCSVNLGWVNPKDRRAKSRCNEKNVNRIAFMALQTEPNLAVNSASLKCE